MTYPSVKTIPADQVRPGDHVWIGGTLRHVSEVIDPTPGQPGTISIHHGGGVTIVGKSERVIPYTPAEDEVMPDPVEVGRKRRERAEQVREKIAQHVAMEVIEQSAGIAPGGTEVSDYGIAYTAALRAINAYRGEN